MVSAAAPLDRDKKSTAPVRTFVPSDIDLADFAQLEPLYQKLLGRPINSKAELETWLRDFSELAAAVDEYGSRRYIDKSCHTDDKEIEKRYMHFVEHIEPKIKPLNFELQKKYLATPYRNELSGKGYFVLNRNWQADVDIFREESIALETEATKLTNDYDKISGAMMVNFQGKEYTMQQMAKFGEKTDRALRQAAFETSAARRLQDREQIDEIFEKLLPLRAKIATNAGMSDYRAYRWKALKRFEYTPEDCVRFADAIEKTCVPLVKKLDQQRKQDLGIDRLRPFDLAVDPQNSPPLVPFKEDEVDQFIEKTRSIFDRLSPELSKDFDLLRARDNLDLKSRKGKQPGGYLMPLEESHCPFIFMNAAGLHRDVETLLHEGGHAFHHLAACGEMVFLRSAPMEFCEVASMAMELFGAEHYDVFYSEADAARARRVHLEGIIRFFPWMATIDMFQHWIYTHPGHSRAERTRFWLSLMDRFGGLSDWSGYEPIRESMWQRQAHLFHHAFYYIEYGIAQLGALQLWMKAKEDPKRALANYRAALKFGGTRPLPELFSAAGIQFDFSQKTLGPLMDAIGEDLKPVNQ